MEEVAEIGITPKFIFGKGLNLLVITKSGVLYCIGMVFGFELRYNLSSTMVLTTVNTLDCSLLGMQVCIISVFIYYLSSNFVYEVYSRILC